jgi:hypothetical protein
MKTRRLVKTAATIGSLVVALSSAPAGASEPVAVWAQKCFADYDDFRSKWDPVAKRVRAALVALKGKDFYEAFPRMRGLYIGLKAEAEKVGFNKGVSFDNATNDGIAYEVAAAILDLQRRTNRGFTSFFDPARFDRGHVETGRADFDRNHYCARAYSLGTHRTDALQFDPHERTINSPWLAQAQSDAFYKEEAALLERTNQIFAASDTRPVVSEYGQVKSVRKESTGTVLIVAHTEQPTNCFKTNRPRRIYPNGQIEYDTDCVQVKKPIFYYNVKVSFRTPLPEVRAGDDVTLVGYETGGAHVLEGVHLQNLIRGTKELGDWNLYARIQ